MIEIKPATTAAIEEFYGLRPKQTVRAVAVFRDGELVAIAGVTLERGQMTAFSDVKAGVTAPKQTIWRVAKRVMAIIGQTRAPVHAIAETPNAGGFLSRLGFQQIGIDEHSEVYEWRH